MTVPPETKSTEGPNTDKQWHERDSAIFKVGGIFFGIWLLGVIPYAVGALGSSNSLEPSLGGAGLFGDSFGAINALLSALGVAFVVLALFKQQAELQHTREELRHTLETNREMAAHQEKLAMEQQRAVAIEALRIHCDSLEAQLSTYTAIAAASTEPNDPSVLDRASACRMISFYSTELANAASALTLSRGEPLRLLNLVENLTRRSLLNTILAVAEIAEELVKRDHISGLYFLEMQFDSTATAMEQAGFEGALESHLNTRNLPRAERMLVIAERGRSLWDDFSEEVTDASMWFASFDKRSGVT